MDVRQIEYFVLAAKAGSFSAAAKSAFVTQQTLSASVASLEGEVKTPLFHRRRQGIELTDFGARFLPKCERVLEAVREAEGLPSGGMRARAIRPLLPTPPQACGKAAPVSPWRPCEGSVPPTTMRICGCSS